MHKQPEQAERNNESLPIAEKYAKEVVRLPMFYGITSEDVDRVIKAVNEYEPKRVLKR